MKKRTSLKDIAKEAGVSIATVSYVLSKQENSGVSQEVSDRIKAIAKKLNYRPNQIAKSLQSGKSHTIGLVVADISNPFFAQIARIVEDQAKTHGYTVIFGSSDENATKSGDLIKFLLNRQVDGFIITPSEGSEAQIQLLKEQNIPFVLIDRYFPNIDTNYVVIDNYKAALDATKQLMEHGKKRIGMVAYASELQHMQERIQGYRDALDGGTGQEFLLQRVEFSGVVDNIPRAIDNLVKGKDPVDALFLATNTLGVLGLKYLHQLKLRVPEDIAVIVFDESEVFHFFYCPLTYVKQPLSDLATRAVGVLLNQIKNPDAKPERVKLEAQLIIGKSSI